MGAYEFFGVGMRAEGIEEAEEGFRFGGRKVGFSVEGFYGF